MDGWMHGWKDRECADGKIERWIKKERERGRGGERERERQRERERERERPPPVPVSILQIKAFSRDDMSPWPEARTCSVLST